MSIKLVQKQLFKGSTEYEIAGEQINIRVKSRFKGEKLSVMLAVLDPEPVITRSSMQFVSRVNGEVLLSLALSRPNVSEFNDFVKTLKQRAQAEYNSFSGIKIGNNPDSSEPYAQQPPEFDDVSLEEIAKGKTVHVEGVENAIRMLQTYVNNDEVQPLIVALDALKQSPGDRSKLVDVATEFNALGSTQGAVLTYAPYVSIMLSDDPFGSR